jgi:hypothetical protein
VKLKDVVDRRGRKQGKKEILASKWKRSVPLAARAMLHAGDMVIVAGTPDTVDKDDPWKIIEGRGQGSLLIISATDGKLQSELSLESPPVIDGMAAARGRLVVATQSGMLIGLK